MKTSSTKPAPSFKKILVATDFSTSSRSAFQIALNLAVELRASLSILHVFEYGDVLPPEVGGQPLELENIYSNAQRSLNALFERTRNVGVACETSIETGVAATTILDKISSSKIDLVVLGTSDARGAERFIFGSTAESVFRKSPCPVVTVGPQIHNAEVKIEGPVVFATDFEHSTIDAIRYAASFSTMAGSSLHCLHVLPRTIKTEMKGHIVSQVMAEALKHLATENGITANHPVCVTTYDNEVPNGIVDYARKQRAKLIVLGVRRGRMAASHVSGHIAYRIIADSPCPVMTVAFSSYPIGSIEVTTVFSKQNTDQKEYTDR
jgi:nucleotide-binding universal stress UspA family protein